MIAKVLAERMLRATANIDFTAFFSWLKEEKLSSTAVLNVIAVQEGHLITKVHPSCVTLDNYNCRGCGITKETIEHMTMGRSNWLLTLYIDRHESVARCLHYRICEK